MSDVVVLVVLPSIAGHAHVLNADGEPTCGCVPRVAVFDVPSHTTPASSIFDVGSDIPGGGAA